MRMTRLFAIALLALGLVALVGCKEEGPAESLGKQVDQAASDAADAADDAAADVQDAMNDK
ncbi:MAG: hypothetical protein ACYTG1_04860 [Planctomycetota bacterium]|jgi:hypothetical protein